MPPTTRAGKKAGKKKKAPAPTKPSEPDDLSVFDLDCSPRPPSHPGDEGALLHDDPVPQLTDDGTNLMRMEQVLHEIQVTQRVKPTRMDNVSLDMLLSPKPVREIHSGSVHRTGKWVFLLAPEPFTTEGRTAHSTEILVAKIGGVCFEPFAKQKRSKNPQPKWLSDPNSRELVLEAMGRYLSRFRIELERISRQFLRALLLKCVANAVPQQYRTGAIEFPEQSVSQRGACIYFGVNLPFSGTSDGQFNSPRFLIAKNVPDICANLYVDDIFAFTFSKDALKKTSPAQRQLLKFIESQCAKYAYGTVATDDEVLLLANALKYQYCAHRGSEVLRGPYQGFNIVATGRGVVQRKRGAAAGDFYPADAVEETTKHLPTIRFASSRRSEEQHRLNHRQVHFRVAEAAHLRFVETGSIEEAWMAACEMADEILEFGDEALYPICGESEEDRERTLHCCRDCWFVWPCSKLQRIDDRLVCPLCRNASDAVMTGEAYERTTFPSEQELETAYARTMVDDAERKKAAALARQRFDERRKDIRADIKVRPTLAQPNPDDYKHHAHKKARDRVRSEMDTLKIPIENMDKDMREFEARYPPRVGYNETWADEYSTERLQPNTDIAPLRSSNDAVLPIFLSDDGKVRVHTYPNMRMTTDYLNKMKFVFPAIMLKVIWHLNTTAREEGEDRDSLLRRLDHLYLIRLQVPWSTEARLRFQMSRADFNAFVQQCQTGIATVQGCSRIIGRSRIWKVKGLSRTASSTEPPGGVSTPQLEEVKKLLETLESKTGQCLDRINGVPYPFKGGPRPAEWSWKTLYALFSVRLRILLRFCNARWVTTATVPALIVVCFWQCLERKSANSQWPECREWLNLPLSMYGNHPLSISVGKADHAAGMATGFKDNKALTFDSFDMAECNILMETWSSNRTKKNWDADVDKILDHFTNTLRPEALPHWPLQLPPLPPSSTIPELEGKRLPSGDDDSCNQDFDDELDDEYQDESTADYVDDVVGNFAGDSEFQPNTDGRELPPQRTAAQTIPARTAIDGQRPQYRNLTNLQGTCYFSTVVQLLYGIPHVRSFVNSPINFRFVQKAECRRLVATLRGIFCKLAEGGRKLPAAETRNLLREAEAFGNDYGKEAHDSMELFQQFLDMLIETSSATSAGGESARPLEQMTAQLEETQNPLKGDAEKIWAGFTRNGRETLLAETLYHQIARERVCTSCGFIDRLFQQLATVIIESPDGIKAPAEKRYDLKELFRDYVLDTAAEAAADRVSRCPVTTCKSVLGPQTRRIVKTPQILSFTFRRVLLDSSGQEQKWLNQVEVPEHLNLAEYVDDVSLPSERKPTAPGSTPMRWITHEMTDYTLQATIHYRATGAHYVAYVRHDDKWIRFDDIKETPDECSPWDGIRETPGETVYVAVYLKSKSPPPLQPPAQAGEKHPRPGTSDSTAAERNQRQGFPLTGSPLISDSRPGATTPAEQPQYTKTKTSKDAEDSLFHKFKAQIGPMLPGADLDKRMKQLTQQLQTQQNNFIAEIKEHMARSSQQPATVNSEDLAREIKKHLMQAPQQLPVRTDQDFARILKQVQSDVDVLKKQIPMLQTSSAAQEQTKQLVAEMAEMKACIMRLPTEPSQTNSQLSHLKEAVGRIERQVLQNANALENERRVRQEIAAEEAKLAAGKAKIADLEAKLANSRK